MNFIVDAQLPLKLALALVAAGHDAIHTLNLPDQNRSSDTFITHLADSEERIVVSKDADFVASHIHSELTEAAAANINRQFAQCDASAARTEPPRPN